MADIAASAGEGSAAKGGRMAARSGTERRGSRAGPAGSAPGAGSDSAADLAGRQFGVITRRQALACGLNRDTLHRRTRAGGPWQRLLPGVYLMVSGTPTHDQRDLAALLYAGPGSMLTGAAALRRHGVRAPRSGTIDVLVPGRRRRHSTGFVTIHLTMRMPPQICYLGSVEYVPVARAVADAARGLRDLPEIRAIVASAVQSRQCTVGQLGQELCRGPVRGSALLRQALAEVADGVRSASEADLRVLIRGGRLPMPMFNARLYCGNELLAVPDAWWPDVALAAEADSREWHLTPEDWERTMRRHARMTALGLLVLHFTPRQIRYEPDQVLSTIRVALESRRGQPVPRIRVLPASG